MEEPPEWISTNVSSTGKPYCLSSILLSDLPSQPIGVESGIIRCRDSCSFKMSSGGADDLESGRHGLTEVDSRFHKVQRLVLRSKGSVSADTNFNV